jgi:hypothetical protein
MLGVTGVSWTGTWARVGAIAVAVKISALELNKAMEEIVIFFIGSRMN